MHVEVDLHDRRGNSTLTSIERKLDTIIALLRQSINQEEQQMATLEDLAGEVSANGNAVSSAVQLLNGLSQQLRDAVAQNDPAAINALADQLDANTAALSEAVTANTPAAPDATPPTEEPAPEEPPA